MTLAAVVARVRSEHDNCCITDSYVDEGCRLDIRGFPGPSLTAIDGTRYQGTHKWEGRLCDRIIISQSDGNFVCAAELKGGNGIHMSGAIDQIQRGLDLAGSLLQTRSPGNWYPLLVYSGSMSGRERDLLRNKRVTYRGRKSRVDRIDCGSRLRDYINRQL